MWSGLVTHNWPRGVIILKRALITGASSGIGKVSFFPMNLLSVEYETVLVARRLERLQTISDQSVREI